MKTRANDLANHLLEAEGDPVDPRDFIMQAAAHQTPLDVKNREATATRKARAEELLRELDKKHAAARALGEVTPDTDARTFWHRRLTYKDGIRPLEVRRMGATKRWITRPDEFRIPFKYGMYETGYIDHNNKDEWTTVRPPDKARIPRR